jgi:FAD-linked sulfhydryl oxidase
MTLNKANIDPKIWGPYFWETFHLSTLGYPENPTDAHIFSYKRFYTSFMEVLPCEKCSHSAMEIITASNLDEGLKSRKNLILWGYNFHNTVNKKLDKKLLSFEDFKKKISDRNSTTSYRGALFDNIFSPNKLPIFIIVCIGLFFIFKNYT